MSDVIAKGPMSGKVNSQALNDNRGEADRILAHEAGQLRIKVVNMCNVDQNAALLDDLSECASHAEEIAVLTRWENELSGGPGLCERCLQLELLGLELLRAMEAYRHCPSHAAGTWVRVAESDLRKALEA